MYCAYCVKILCPGHVRSGHQATLCDTTSGKVRSPAKRTVLIQLTSNFLVFIRTQRPTICLSRFRSGQFCDFAIISQWGNMRMTRTTTNRPVSIQLSYCMVGLIHFSWTKCRFNPGTPSKVIWGHPGSITVFLPISFYVIVIETCGSRQCVCVGQTNRLICNMTRLGKNLTLTWGQIMNLTFFEVMPYMFPFIPTR